MQVACAHTEDHLELGGGINCVRGALDEDVFFRTVRASFAMRRKKLSNGLASGFPELGKQGAADVIAACGFDENVRGETLSIPEFARIANEIVRRRKA